MSIEWRDVVGYDGVYQVSNTGLVRSIDRYYIWRGRRKFKPGRTMAIVTGPSGHKMVTLWRDGVKTTHRVHRVVLDAFTGPCPDGMEGCHTDGDAGNNNVENLRWDTRSANQLDSVRHGTHPTARRTHCPKGHPYDADNTYTPPCRPTWRRCRACLRDAETRRVRDRRKVRV